MKLTLTHNDILSGICAFLGTRGLTGFDPSAVHAEFTKGRDGKLSVVLDDEAPVAAVVAQQVAEKKETKASAAAAEVKETPAAEAGASATEGGANAAAQAEPQSEAVAEVKSDAAAEPVAEPAGQETQAASEENLFG